MVKPSARSDAPGYTWHIHDSDTDLTYMQARFYDPIAGRFLSTDPIGYQDQLNLYAYVHNDPINGWDPNGMKKVQATRTVRTASSSSRTKGTERKTSITVEIGELTNDEAEEVFSQISDDFFIANDGQDISGSVSEIKFSGDSFAVDRAMLAMQFVAHAVSNSKSEYDILTGPLERLEKFGQVRAFDRRVKGARATVEGQGAGMALFGGAFDNLDPNMAYGGGPMTVIVHELFHQTNRYQSGTPVNVDGLIYRQNGPTRHQYMDEKARAYAIASGLASVK